MDGMSVTTQRLAFIHIPKTAGTSITQALADCFGDSTCPAMTTLDYCEYDTDHLAEYRLFKGHAYRRDYTRLPPGTVRFTVLRDPVARALSYYRYYRGLDVSATEDPNAQEAIRLARSHSVIEFVYSDSPFVIEHLRLGQVRQFLTPDTLAAIGHRQFLSRELRARAVAEFVSEIAEFDYGLTVEALRLSFPLMMRELHLNPAALPRSNASEGNEPVDMADLRRAMVDVSGAEFECYEHVRRREMAWITARLVRNLTHAGQEPPSPA